MPETAAARKLRRDLRRLRRGVRRRLRRLVQRVGVQGRHSAGLRTGMVEQFTPPLVEGWIAVSPGSPGVPVRLRVNDRDIVTLMVADRAKRRVPGSEAREFRFVVDDLWDYVSANDRVRVLVGDQSLPIVGHGTYYRPDQDGSRRLSELLTKLDEGYGFSPTGELERPR
jgi:hypothetical protein